MSYHLSTELHIWHGCIGFQVSVNDTLLTERLSSSRLTHDSDDLSLRSRHLLWFPVESGILIISIWFIIWILFRHPSQKLLLNLEVYMYDVTSKIQRLAWRLDWQPVDRQAIIWYSTRVESLDTQRCHQKHKTKGVSDTKDLTKKNAKQNRLGENN